MKKYIIVFLCFVSIGLFANPLDKEINNRLMWINAAAASTDTYIGFRGKITLEKETELDVQLSGASSYTVWVDGNEFTQGPDRFHPSYPEYQKRKLNLSKGSHLIAVQVHYAGIEVRYHKDIKPFLYFKMLDGNLEVPVLWKADYLKGYIASGRRINGNLGWIEWCDFNALQEKWQQPEFDDSSWQPTVFVPRDLGAFSASRLDAVKFIPIKPKLITQGELAEIYGVFNDLPGSTFYTRDLDSKNYPPEGVWYRFDLGKVMLSRAKLTLDLPKGTIVEIGHSEYLLNGRVTPWIANSGSDTYNLHRFVARGGVQEICPVIPLGGRFVEVHIKAPKAKVKLLDYSFIQRSYWNSQQGSFTSDDELLNKIWQIGVETVQSCAEDAITDNPTRERGQWVGDYSPNGMRIIEAAYTDKALLRRALVQAVQSAFEDGLIQSQSPGHASYIPSFCMLWTEACLEYVRMTGDKSLIAELHLAARKNMNAFDQYWTAEGLVTPYWNFIDWGYATNAGKSDMALNLFYLQGLRAMEKWELALGEKEYAKKYNTQSLVVEKTVRNWMDQFKAAEGYNYDSIGYNRTVLALRAGLFADKYVRPTVEAMKKHILNCFPNNPAAPRLRTSDLDFSSNQLITPYFAGFAFPLLFENGEAQFALDQYKSCWGWGINQGLTTWMEVFDLRWSHSHYWSGAPTWQLSRYVLGILPTFDKKMNSFTLDLKTGNLQHAEGKIPLPSGKMVDVKWRKVGEKIQYELLTQEPIELTYKVSGKMRTVKVKDKVSLVL